ncbi:EcsC family protein [Azospirillum sp. A26]|uniref:EcsC family protein n=1 Tax=Azospirillum sp. A26 TaxID=3160607 RepID=UPI00366E0D53
MTDAAAGDLGDQKNWAVQLLDKAWSGVVLADNSWNPEQSCYDLYEEYKKSGRTPDECVENFIDWQTAKAAGTGFVLGMPGLVFGAVTIPADLTITTYLQMRMIAVIALLYGWDAKSDRLKTLALLSMLGSGGGEVLRSAGVKVGTKLTARVIAKIPGRVLIEINKAIGIKLFTKAGTTGIINLTKLVPVVGGLVSGGLNGYMTRQIGYAAKSILCEGPDCIQDAESDPEPAPAV